MTKIMAAAAGAKPPKAGHIVRTKPAEPAMPGKDWRKPWKDAEPPEGHAHEHQSEHPHEHQGEQPPQHHDEKPPEPRKE